MYADSSVLAVDVPSLESNLYHSGTFLAFRLISICPWIVPCGGFPHRERAHLSCVDKCFSIADYGWMKEDRRGAKGFLVLFKYIGAAKMMQDRRPAKWEVLRNCVLAVVKL
jgi:hypothetical protein